MATDTRKSYFTKALLFFFCFFSLLLPSTPDWRNYPAALSPLLLLRRQMGRKGAALVQSRGLLLQILRRTWKRRRRDGRPIRLSALFLGSSPHDLIATFCKSTIQFSTPGIKSGADIWECEGGGVEVPRLFVPAPLSVSADWPHSEPRGESECHLHSCDKIPHSHDRSGILSAGTS